MDHVPFFFLYARFYTTSFTLFYILLRQRILISTLSFKFLSFLKAIDNSEVDKMDVPFTTSSIISHRIEPLRVSLEESKNYLFIKGKMKNTD